MLLLIIGLLFAAPVFAQEIVVSSIDIEGLKATREWVVRRELAFSVGDTIRQEDLVRAENSLKNLKLFNSVFVSADSAGAVSALLSEQWQFIPLLSASATDGTLDDALSNPENTFDIFTFYAGMADLNFLGDGGKIYWTYQFGAAEGFAAEYETRWLSPALPLAVSLQFGNLLVSDRHARVLKETRKLRSRSVSLEVGTRKGAANRIGLQGMYSYIRQETRPPAEGRRSETAIFSPFVVLDRRNLEWYPARGAFASVRSYHAFGTEDYTCSQYDLRSFLPILDKKRPPLIALRLQGATSTSSTPSWSHYYYGFGTKLRGYGDVKSESSNLLVGDLELRFPLTAETYYSLKWFGSYGERLPFGIAGFLFVQRAQLGLDGTRQELLGWGGGLHVRVPYVQIAEAAVAWNRDGDMDVTLMSGVSF